MAFLTKGLRIILRDNRTEEETFLEGGSVVDSAAENTECFRIKAPYFCSGKQQIP